MGIFRGGRRSDPLGPEVVTRVGFAQFAQALRSRSRRSEQLATAAFLVLAATLLYISGRPLHTDDTWWHLTLGRAFTTYGPLLETVPALHTSVSPPIPAAWLSDVLLYHASLPFGLVGLRILHVIVVASLLAGAWLALRRAGGSSGLASLGAGLFLVLSAYRLVQLRPELVTILATIVLYLALLQPRDVPSWRRVGFAAALCGLWSNLHPGFPLGPILIGAACSGLLLERSLGEKARERVLEQRAWRIGWATLLGAGASLVNPMGIEAHLAYFRAGKSAPAMSFVSDEWMPLDPFRLPLTHLPPSLLGWIAYWTLVIATLYVIAIVLRNLRSPSRAKAPPFHDLDAALLPLALLGLVAPLIAVRFLWLSLFPLLLLASAARGSLASGRSSGSWNRLLALLTLLLVPAFHRIGDWPLLSSGISRATYSDSYDRWKYYGHATRFLHESELEGNLYNSYFMGGFLGYWLAPRMRVFIDGSLNVPPQVMTDYLVLQHNRESSQTTDTESLLDRHEVDVYLGIGLPTPPIANRPRRHTALHLHRHPDWILVFRNLDSAVYLRRNERNRENLKRVETYYAGTRVAFDPNAGFDVAHVINEAPDWASAHGLLPKGLEPMMAESKRFGTNDSIANLVSATYLALGLDERALESDDALVRKIPTASGPRRRRIGALLRLGRIDEALDEAGELDQLQPADGLSRSLILAARRFSSLDRAERSGFASRLPVLSHAEARLLRALQVPSPLFPDRIPRKPKVGRNRIGSLVRPN